MPESPFGASAAPVERPTRSESASATLVDMTVETVGRQAELESIHAFLERAAEGPRALVLEGEAGIGKSTLWVAGVEAARTRGFRVLVSRPAEAERRLTHAGLGDLFEGVLESVLPALPAPGAMRWRWRSSSRKMHTTSIRARSVSRFGARSSCSPPTDQSSSRSTTTSGSIRPRRAHSRSRCGGWTSTRSYSCSPVASANVRRRQTSSGR